PMTGAGAAGAALPLPAAVSDHGPAAAGAGTGGGASSGQPAERFNPQGMIGANPSGADPRAKMYAIITGIVPWSKQCEEYGSRFEFAVPPVLQPSDPSHPAPLTSAQTGQAQLPEYIGFRVQRTEAIEPQEADWAAAKSLYIPALNDLASWSNQSALQDIVDPNYIFHPQTLNPKNGSLTTYIPWPFPPLFLKNFGFEATHPKVKLNLPQAAPDAPQPQAADLAQGNVFDNAQGVVVAQPQTQPRMA